MSVGMNLQQLPQFRTYLGINKQEELSRPSIWKVFLNDFPSWDIHLSGNKASTSNIKQEASLSIS